MPAQHHTEGRVPIHWTGDAHPPSADFDAASWFAGLILACPPTITPDDLVRTMASSLQDRLGGTGAVCVLVNLRGLLRGVPVTRPVASLLAVYADGSRRDVRIDLDECGGDVPTALTLLAGELEPTGLRREEREELACIECYELDKAVDLGAVVTWKPETPTPLECDTSDLLRQLRPYLHWLLLVATALHMIQQPLSIRFFDVLNVMRSDAGLTERETEVLFCRLSGFRNKDIAAKLGLRIDTILTHMKHVYEKTGEHGVMKIFCKYFAPQLYLGEADGHNH